MRRIVVANRKGGVGKTTTAVNLAVGISTGGQRTLLIDCDTQGQCALCLGVNAGQGLADVLADGVAVEEAAEEVRPGLWFLAGGRKLSGVSRLIARENVAPERFMSRRLASASDCFDVAIIDTAPGFNELSVNALVYATDVLIPVSFEILAVHGLAAFVAEIQDLRELAGLELPYTILPTFRDGRVKKTAEIMSQLQKHFGTLVRDPIPYSSAVSRAPGYGQAMQEYDIGDRATVAYLELAGRWLRELVA